jgi:alkanesulfonate monooxygenase SsuD/methylene tetrahydromethanopterin reductase-like flavin-dependent oxidoreductase (luciferase family)
VRFRKPVQTTRETIEIIRIVSRGERLEHSGEIYPLPLPDSSGAPLQPLVRPTNVPIYIAAMGAHNLQLTGELADGWLGNAVIPEAIDVFLGPLRQGVEKAGRTLSDLELVAPVAVEIHDDEASADAAARRHADGYASRSARWALAAATSTTTRSRGWAMEPKCRPSPSCGKPENATKRAVPCHSTSAG